jgi:hypothetical protein
MLSCVGVCWPVLQLLFLSTEQQPSDICRCHLVRSALMTCVPPVAPHMLHALMWWSAMPHSASCDIDCCS